MPIHAHFFWRDILTQKVVKMDLVFGMPSVFISGVNYGRIPCSIFMKFTSLCNHIVYIKIADLV